MPRKNTRRNYRKSRPQKRSQVQSTEIISQNAPLMRIPNRNRFEHSTVISQWVDKGTITTGSSPTFGAYSFLFTDLPDSSNYAGAYDQYRFRQVEVCLIPLSGKPLPASTFQGAYLVIVTDYDDASAPSALSTLLAYGNATIVPVGETHRRAFRPHMAIAAYGSSAFTSYCNKPADWVDCASTTVNHYGIKIGTQSSSSSLFTNWQLMVRYTIELKSQR